MALSIPGRGLVDAVGLVAQARFQRGPFQADGAGVPVREALDSGVFLAEADAAGQQHQGCVEAQPAEIQCQAGSLAVIIGETCASWARRWAR